MASRGKWRPDQKEPCMPPEIPELDQTSYKMPLKKSKIGSNTVRLMLQKNNCGIIEGKGLKGKQTDKQNCLQPVEAIQARNEDLF